MAAVSVFVDDAIRGRLPMVCAKTGRPADVLIRMQQPVGGDLGFAPLLLLFLGPVGITILIVLALIGPRAEYLVVQVPQTDAAWRHARSMERFRLSAFAAGVVSCLCAVLVPGRLPGTWLALGAILVVVAGALHVMVLRQQIGVSIEVTRRWVTFTNVHPRFAAAVEAQELVRSSRTG